MVNAVNMPYDELAVRAPIELQQAGTVAVFCQYDRACEEDQRARNTLTQCATAGGILTGLGISEVRLVTATLDELRAENVPIVTTARPRLARVTIPNSAP
jgi:hypothetical protein